ncbi:hypothetical protein K504DRAFT_453988 [Pleomassaria siparia CBS 279.74]|uniref:tRNA-splicing endonuclease subunit Sen15 domain-containing protein n=1 Tax=Pleomassaria siparia CBS 279.74 TaxID=1314801 RepID=A0A6G1KF31_9PLEO|nr:hypothetical protein K504DRAFT_453988 [Pleomassaria siparia CBS 279.74]
MTQPDDRKQAVLPSPLQTLLLGDLDRNSPKNHLPSLHSLALQVQHNLQYMHSWTDLRIHTHSPITNQPLPRPLLSGLPPLRLYVHPDEQIELLKQADRQRIANKEAGGGSNALVIKPDPEYEWILPTRLSEKWTLRRLADVFGAISMVPPEGDSAMVNNHGQANRWRSTKRIVMATADTDSTIVYYIIHDGVVKPRPN